MMYDRSAEVYDALYTPMKDYGREVEVLGALLNQYAHCPVQSLLDVACGTGLHLEHFRHLYDVEGLDLSEAQLAIARTRLPDLPLHHADMSTFRLNRTFDAVTCLFSAVGHLEDVATLRQAVRQMTAHLNEGGVLIVEPWIFPEEFRDGSIHLNVVDEPELKVTRVSISRREGNRSPLEMHHTVARPGQIHSFVEEDALTMFTHDEYLDVFKAAGLTTHHQAMGFSYTNRKSRGLYIGVK